MQRNSDLHSKFTLGPQHEWKYCIDIQSAAAEIRRRKTDRKKEEEDRNHRAKIKWPALFHRAAINTSTKQQLYWNLADMTA